LLPHPKVNFESAKCSVVNNVLQMISILVHDDFLKLACEVYCVADSMQDICFELLIQGFLNSMRWPGCGALGLSVIVVVLDQEAYH
jgi:hypothetical protein